MFTSLKVRVARSRTLGWPVALLTGELPFRRIDTYRPGIGFGPGEAPSIQPNVWSTWITDRFGRSHARGIEEFRERNPEYTFHLWTDAECDSFMAEHFSDHPILDVYRRGRFGPLRSDIWRYSVLLVHGGWYFDIKSCLTVPLRDFAPHSATAVVAYEHGEDERIPAEARVGNLQHPARTMVNWGIGFAAGHPLLARLLDDAARTLLATGTDVVERPWGAIVESTGPYRLALTAHEWSRAEGTTGLHECGIEFGDVGRYEMNGSWTRLLLKPHYGQRHNEPLLESA